MKSIPVVVFIAAVAALAVVPFQSVAAFSILFAAGIASIAFADYARAYRPLPIAAVPIARTTIRAERFRLAA